MRIRRAAGIFVALGLFAAQVTAAPTAFAQQAKAPAKHPPAKAAAPAGKGAPQAGKGAPQGKPKKGPPKHARNYRRTKSSKAAANRWSEAAAPQASTPQTQTQTQTPSAPAAADEPLGTAPPAPARLMAAAFGGPSGDSRRGVSSPRPKGREAKNTFCRNVTIYGHCRYENSAYPSIALLGTWTFCIGPP